MGDLSDYEASRLGNAALRNTAYTPAAAVYVALSTDGAAEISGNGYARTSATFAAFGGTSASTNASVITFPIPTGSWGTITHARIYDASSAGNAITDWVALNLSKTVAAWDTFSFAAGDLDFTF